MRVRVRGEYGFSSLVKQKKKAKICFVIYIAGFFFKTNFCYEVFAKQKKTKESRQYYSHIHKHIYINMHTKIHTKHTYTGTCAVHQDPSLH